MLRISGTLDSYMRCLIPALTILPNKSPLMGADSMNEPRRDIVLPWRNSDC